MPRSRRFLAFLGHKPSVECDLSPAPFNLETCGQQAVPLSCSGCQRARSAGVVGPGAIINEGAACRKGRIWRIVVSVLLLRRLKWMSTSAQTRTLALVIVDDHNRVVSRLSASGCQRRKVDQPFSCKSGFCRRDIGWREVERARSWCISQIPATTTIKRTEKGH